MSDLSLFADIWLLVPCWLESQMNRYDLMGMAMGGGQSAMMSSPMMMGTMSMETTSALKTAEPEPVFPTETDLAEFILGVNEIIDFMDAAMEDNPGDSERFLEIKTGLEVILEDLRDSILAK